MKQAKKNKNIIFNEQIDNSINTLAISLTFILIGLMLYFRIIDFANKTISTIFQWIFIIFGFLMTFTGFNNKENNPYKIKGFDSLGIGIVFLVGWYFLNKIEFFLTDILSILVLIIGIYGTIRGIIEIIYSLKIKIENIKTESISKILTEIILFLTKISALVLSILNILQALKII